MPSTNFISTFCAQFKLFSLNLDLHRCSESIGVLSVNTLVEFFAYYLCNFLHVYFRVLPFVNGKLMNQRTKSNARETKILFVNKKLPD